MKKILLILILLLGLCANAEPLTGGVEWIEITQEARDERIEQFRPEEFSTAADFGHKKDADYRRNVMLASEGLLETDKVKLCAFHKGKLLYMYAIQYKDNPRNAYYYSLLGKLYYVDEMSDNYPNFPYTSRQYRANGKPVSYIYFEDRDTQYMYAPNGGFRRARNEVSAHQLGGVTSAELPIIQDSDFTGLWYKDKMYDRFGKQLLTRTNW